MTQKCNCIEKYFDLHVSTIECKTLVIEDQSKWMDSKSPEPMNLLIRVPSVNKEISVIVNPESRNLFTVSDLFNKGKAFCLPDDIYCFEVTSCGVKYLINRAITCNIDCSIEELLAKVDNGNHFEEYVRFKTMSDSIKANARLGRKSVAKNLLKVLKKEFKNRNCENC